jgi:hypothetical protein
MLRYITLRNNFASYITQMYHDAFPAVRVRSRLVSASTAATVRTFKIPEIIRRQAAPRRRSTISFPSSAGYQNYPRNTVRTGYLSDPVKEDDGYPWGDGTQYREVFSPV